MNKEDFFAVEREIKVLEWIRIYVTTKERSIVVMDYMKRNGYNLTKALLYFHSKESLMPNCS